jgi:hypothetical protein
MKAICENCGRAITAADFGDGRYLLFWITPTRPSESLYLCQDCRTLSWDERKQLFLAWQERHTLRNASQRRGKRRKQNRLMFT